MKLNSLRNPTHILNTLVASEVEVIRSRDPELSSVLDVPPPAVEQLQLTEDREPAASVRRGVVYRSARSVYRTLERFGPLRPSLRAWRSRVVRLRLRRNDHRQDKPLTFPLMFPKLVRTFTIAFTMRSGSNEICSLLAKNGLGSPNEFFQNPLPQHPFGVALDSFARVVKQNQIEGVFGSKMSHDHRAALDEQLRSAIPGYHRIDDLLPRHRWVWLVRRDKILQAISWCRAEASNQWISGQSNAVKPEGYGYDFFDILSRTMLIYAGELAWETYFHENSIKPLIVVYEDFFRDLEHQLGKLVDYLGGLPAERTSLDTGATFEIQRNEKSYAIKQRFISDLGRIGERSMAQELGEQLQRWVRFLFEQGWRG